MKTTDGQSGQGPLVKISDSDATADRVLESLNFRRMTDRFDEVVSAHKETFEWIFHDPAAGDKPWDNFTQWLECGSGCYWICGKAGSGKSTLMKFIHENEATQVALRTWAGEFTLVTASFFFWNLGSPLQKSQAGLMRSLLSYVLQLHPWLMPQLLPGLYRDAASRTTSRLDEPSFAELRKAFSKMVNLRSSPLKICFFIDGVDEYEGDETELCELFAAVSSAPHIKLVLSSRPVTACVEAFTMYPKLRLQDLTYNDILRYVEDKLVSHTHMQTLRTRDKSAAEQLVTDICCKAQGVFLWVMLVVRSLMKGLQSRDRISELERRLEKLPPDLEALYDHMLRTMSEEYRQQASQIFQIVLESLEVQTEQPLTALQLSYAEEEAPCRALMMISTDEVLEKVKAARAEEIGWRLLSRCCGLVELHDRVKPRAHQQHLISETAHIVHNYVVFLHKTVVEFLRTPKIWANILTLTASSGFDPNLALLGSCLFEIKACHLDDVHRGRDSLHEVIQHACIYAGQVEEMTGITPSSFLNELDKTIRSDFKYTNLYGMANAVEAWATSLLNMAAMLGLPLYVEEQLRKGPSTETSDRCTKLLKNVLRAFIDPHPLVARKSLVKVVQRLIQYGADPSHFQTQSNVWPGGVQGSSRAFLLHVLRNYESESKSPGFMRREDQDDYECWLALLSSLFLPEARQDTAGGSSQSHEACAIRPYRNYFPTLNITTPLYPIFSSLLRGSPIRYSSESAFNDLRNQLVLCGIVEHTWGNEVVELVTAREPILKRQILHKGIFSLQGETIALRPHRHQAHQ